MAKIRVRYLTSRRGRHDVTRWFFQPHGRDRAHGWRLVRLHDAAGNPISDPIEAAVACEALVRIYDRWKARDPAAGPHLIDELGRVIETKATEQPAERPAAPGTIAAIVADYKQHSVFTKLSANSRRTYAQSLNLLSEAWGPWRWSDISESQAKAWIEMMMEDAPAFGHATYRVARAALNKTKLIYEDKNHPGRVPKYANPFEKLDIETPTSELLPWPMDLVRAFAAHCDASGQPSLGDAVIVNSWLGQRINDLIALPALRIDADRPLWLKQRKTSADVTIPWQVVPEIAQRIAQAQQRRKSDKIAALTFLYAPDGQPWDEQKLRHTFADTRADFAKTHPRWSADYAAAHFEDDPFALDVTRIEMRALRHTAVTQLADAQVSNSDIGAITGHAEETIIQILKRYRRRTATQAGNALRQRLTLDSASSLKGKTNER